MISHPPSSLHDIAEHLLDHNYPAERETMADIAALLGNVASAYGAAHPELRELDAIWAELCERLRRHLVEERALLAPYVEQEEDAQEPPSSELAAQRAEILSLVRRVRALTNGYVPPPDACDAYRTLFDSLAAFEGDLQEHLQLDVMFGAARAQE